MLAIRAECGGMAEDNPAVKCLFVSGTGGNGLSDTLVNVAAKDEMDEAQDSDSSADYDADQDWGVAESSGRLPALLSAMVECVKEVTTNLDCLMETRS
jgi:hypothetical protein